MAYSRCTSRARASPRPVWACVTTCYFRLRSQRLLTHSTRSQASSPTFPHCSGRRTGVGTCQPRWTTTPLSSEDPRISSTPFSPTNPSRLSLSARMLICPTEPPRNPDHPHRRREEIPPYRDRRRLPHVDAISFGADRFRGRITPSHNQGTGTPHFGEQGPGEAGQRRSRGEARRVLEDDRSIIY